MHWYLAWSILGSRRFKFLKIKSPVWQKPLNNFGGENRWAIQAPWASCLIWQGYESLCLHLTRQLANAAVSQWKDNIIMSCGTKPMWWKCFGMSRSLTHVLLMLNINKTKTVWQVYNPLWEKHVYRYIYMNENVVNFYASVSPIWIKWWPYVKIFKIVGILCS